MSGYYDKAIGVVEKCANAIERHGQQLSILRDLEATQAGSWMKDMAIEMRKACEEDKGEPGWHNWLNMLLLRNGLIEHPFDPSTKSDLAMREVLEAALRKALHHDSVG